MTGLTGLLAAWAASLLLLFPIERWLRKAGMERMNFRQKPIPSGMGLVWVATGSAVIAISASLQEERTQEISLILALLGFGAVGWLDDRWGTREAGGFKGHLGLLLRCRQVSTGFVKALGGGLLGLALGAMVSQIFPFLFLNALLIVLSANALNLLDVRPGRAIKGFVMMGLLLIGGGGIRSMREVGVVFGPVMAYLPRELRCQAMMGDTGSNSLGAAMGLAMAWHLPVSWKWGVLVGLLFLHGLTEFCSLTRIIEGNRLLRFLDRLGVRPEDA